jgi:hypothetical protein
MAEGLNVILMATLTLDHSKMAKLMARVYTLGVTEKSMMENGIKGWSMVTVYGEDSTTILISANGDHPKQKVMEYTSGKMVIGTKENGNSV